MKRIFVAVDAENVLHPSRRAGTLREGLSALVAAIRALGSEGTVVQGVAVCDRDLQRQVAFELAEAGIRVLAPEESGPDSADRALLAHLANDVPDSAGTVVICSGDHAFAPAARRLRESGRRVELVAVAGGIASELYTAVDSCTYLDVVAAVAA